MYRASKHFFTLYEHACVDKLFRKNFSRNEKIHTFVNARIKRVYNMSNENEMHHARIKDNIATICGEIFTNEAKNGFTRLNYVFPKHTSSKKHLIHKISVFDAIDIYSQTFTTIHTRAKIALREIKSGNFGFDAIELLRMILTLDDELKNRRLKSSRIELKEIVEVQPIIEEKKKRIETESKPKQEKKKQIRSPKIVAPEISGRKLYARKIRDASIINQLHEFDL